MSQFSVSEDFALEQDRSDPLREFRDRFHVPLDSDGKPLIYLCGNSLGLMPRTAREAVNQELVDWENLAVDAHLDGATPWYSYHESVRDSLARLVGAKPSEVVAMNSLTVNLHLMMVSFYRPTRERYKILMEAPAFPSDTYAVKTQIAHHGLNPADALIAIHPHHGHHTIDRADVEAILDKEGDRIALVLLPGVNFFTGQVFDMPGITAIAQKKGCMVGWDLAHAAGNIPAKLHDWNVDFAAWCSYKYLNSGPGAVAGCFVHERHTNNRQLTRFAGWWGNDPSSRFQMHLIPDFVPVKSADAWQISNPPILSMAPLRASLSIFDDARIDALREKSTRLTGYLQFLIDQSPAERFTVVTPRNVDERGCQLSILVHDDPKGLFAKLEAANVKCDFREPNVIRAAPAPLYNTFHEVWRFAKVLAEHR